MTTTTPRKTTTKRKPSVAQREARTKLAMRATAIVGSLPVFGVALYVSYGHIRHVTLLAGESAGNAAIMALSVDGMMLVASVAILAGYRTVATYGGFTLGALASLAANVISADGTPLSYAVAGWPAVAMVLTSEMLARFLLPARPKRRKPARRPVQRAVRATGRQTVPHGQLQTA